MNNCMKGLGITGVCALTLLGVAAPAAGADPDWELVFDGGQVCTFPLVVSGSGRGSQVYREFEDKDGNVRALSAGTGFELTYTNQDTGTSFSSRANGTVTRTLIRPDGSSTLVLTGHNAVFMFPTDAPGPSATLYTGQVVIDIAPDGTWTLVRDSGQSVDICAALITDS